MKNIIKFLFLINGHCLFAQITDTGDKVGIGTPTPAVKLEISTNSSTEANALRLTNTGWASYMSTSLEFKTGNLKSVPTAKISSIMNGSGSAGDRLGFFVQDNGTNPNNSPLVEKLSLLPNGNVGIGITKPYQKLHVNGNIGIGLMSGTEAEGFRIDYVDGGSGTTTFKNNRWGGDIYFKRNSSQGERTQFLFGGAGEHYMNIYNSNNEVKVRFVSGGNSYLNGGNVGIGTTTPDEKLAVNGNIHTKEVRVDLIGWPDFVFNKNYNLPTLKEVEQHIKEKGHLKDIPSVEEVSKNGIFLGDMNAKLLQKIEELTLYTINQEKILGSQEKEIANLKNQTIEQTKELKTQNSKIEKLEKENSELQSLSKRLAEIEKLLGNNDRKIKN